jgi:protein-tyrosine phosphatase
VYRSDGLHRLDDADIDALSALGIADVFDLRSDAELARDGIGRFAGARARHHHCPLVKISLSPFDPDIDWQTVNFRDRYLEMLEEGGETVRAIFAALAARSAAPLVFHCSGGKDRTGVVAALVQRSLGVDDDDILGDYAVSESLLQAAADGVRARLDDLGLSSAAIAYMTSSPPDRMRYTLDELDRRWCSTQGYLRWAGVSAEIEEGVRRNLIEPPDA